MKVMTLYKFHDTDVEAVKRTGDDSVRELVLKESNEGSVLVSKQDVIALAKEFWLTVYESKSSL